LAVRLGQRGPSAVEPLGPPRENLWNDTGVESSNRWNSVTATPKSDKNEQSSLAQMQGEQNDVLGNPAPRQAQACSNSDKH